MAEHKPRWRRRKTARPAEIIDAALEIFADQGFAQTNLDDVARRADVSKGALYLYFKTKEDLFRAVVREAIAPQIEAIHAAAAPELPFAILVPLLLQGAARMMSESRLPSVVRMVISESPKFPDLARVWHDEVVAKVLAIVIRIIERAQARGEVVAGDARLHAFSLVGPLVIGMLFHQVFGGVGPNGPDLQHLAEQHGRSILQGMLRQQPSASDLGASHER